ncbi:Heat shock protein GrpE [hydrothermal vent metagenome]|uniref:Heat shock protein GrpE n=1 Tax=hydrothermal vent metagenome TaxID=652676 RepID=A0A3B1AMA6_9ZZZZ
MSQEKEPTNENVEETEIVDEAENQIEDANDELTAETDLQSLLDAANKKADENWDLILRTKAEMENLRRRSRLDVENAHKFAVEKFVTDLIPVIDSLELGLTAVGKDDHEQLEKLREGTEMTLKMFQDVFNKFDIEAVNPINETFNPEFHQAMVMQETDEVEPNTVLMVMQKGYTLNDRLVRPAMVSVSKAKSPNSDTAAEPTQKIDEKA